MQPDYSYLISKVGINFPLIGFYDTANPEMFKPLMNTTGCLYAFFEHWQFGKYLLITKNRHGCKGAGKWLCGLETRTEEQYVKFLADDEGLKANHNLMRDWLRTMKPYQQKNENIIIGPLRDLAYDDLQTVTFFVTPDQLSMLMIGAQLFHSPTDPEPVIAPFGSGCMQMITLFKDLSIPQAIIGATDLAMRKYIPPEYLTFTVTKSMFEQLCKIGPDSYFEKSFIQGLKAARKSGEHHNNI